MTGLRRRQTLRSGKGSALLALGRRLLRRLGLVACLAAASAATPVAAAGEARTGANGVETWVAEQVSALEGVLARSGLDVEALIARFDEAGGGTMSGGQGGPLVLRLGADPLGEGGAGDLERLKRVRKLLAMVPLAAPMATYKLTSGFGPRRDPFTRRAALHTGQDFGGPRDAPVLATAPGRVVQAKRAGAYGIMVEIDHGMGIRTRYAHLRRALVRPGQKVKVRQKVGVMGNTGRSTGAHLHYEIRVDDRPLDPARFLEAAGELRQLAAVGGPEVRIAPAAPAGATRVPRPRPW